MRDQIEAGVTHTESNNYHKPREINHRGKEAHFCLQNESGMAHTRKTITWICFRPFLLTETDVLGQEMNGW